MKKITSYKDINAVLQELSIGIQQILEKNLIGLYLFGSLVYGDFNEGSSDIDLVAIVNNPLNKNELIQVKNMHQKIALDYKKWCERVECSYTPINMLSNSLPPKEPRPYYGGGIFYEDADYGNEWIINNYLLISQSIALIGPNFSTLINPINIEEVQKACIRDLFREWEPKIDDAEWLDNSHYQAYLIVNLCRILYTVYCAKTASKKFSAEWVKNQYGLRWIKLIEAAESWEYDKDMSSKNEAIEFIKFVINEVKKTKLYQKIVLQNECVKQKS